MPHGRRHPLSVPRPGDGSAAIIRPEMLQRGVDFAQEPPKSSCRLKSICVVASTIPSSCPGRLGCCLLSTPGLRCLWLTVDGLMDSRPLGRSRAVSSPRPVGSSALSMTRTSLSGLWLGYNSGAAARQGLFNQRLSEPDDVPPVGKSAKQRLDRLRTALSSYLLAKNLSGFVRFSRLCSGRGPTV
ncbi:hypothetical protein THAOC_09591 [Thalassiosira oceanica]|uniref:Uncharacterized protein n=1 Tax=Thalassiosira oceanica TaxID=159749 RepID=K0SUW8_THAOC|nr:hypothetical protein THAOC_09591 [Thalassiosira oceanica]|eukprot:EJK69185.1 hypothetical protein THAOC_09591 [Thalassiosira oceanica]